MMLNMLTSEIPANVSDRRAWILFQLRLRGLTLRGLAKAARLSPATFSNALLSPNDRVEGLIAAALNLDQKVLFHDRYDADGRRRYRVCRQSSTGRRGRNVKARAAA